MNKEVRPLPENFFNDWKQREALTEGMISLVGYTVSTVAVSTDFVGSRQTSVVDSEATIVSGINVVLYCWYDNEFSYSCQVVRCIEKFAGVDRQRYPRDI